MSGFTAAPGTDFSQGQEPLLAQRLDALGRYLHVDFTGISGYRTPSHSVAVGGTPNDPHTKGIAADVDGGDIRNVPESTLNQFGLTRPMTTWNGKDERNHIQVTTPSKDAMNAATSHSGGGVIGTIGDVAGGVIQFGADPSGAVAGAITGAVNDPISNAVQAGFDAVIGKLWDAISGKAEYAGLFLVLVLAGVALAVTGLTRTAGRQPQEAPS